VLIQAGRLRPLKQTDLSTHVVLQLYRPFISLIVRLVARLAWCAVRSIPFIDKEKIWL